MQESLLGKPQSHASPHAHSEFDAETSFVVWEHEKEALQARLSQRRERMFRCVVRRTQHYSRSRSPRMQ